MLRSLLLPVSLCVMALFADVAPPSTTVEPCGRDEPFVSSETCSLCHSNHELATAMLSPTGEDASMYDLWGATMMAQAFRDPYWRAQVSREMASYPKEAKAIQALCLRCHAPAHSHAARLSGGSADSVATAAADPLAEDGVTCTVCHQIQPDDLGKPSTFSGRPVIRNEKEIFGPFREPVTGPMQMHTGYTPTHGPWIRKSALCGSCHTLYTGEGDTRYLEQAPYLEWRNSVFTTEVMTPKKSAQDCAECHMKELGTQRIARSPMGADFLIDPRAGVRSHGFVGGNAFMLDLMSINREELGIGVSSEALSKSARRTRAFLRTNTARLEIEKARLEDGEVRFEVAIENLCGHKFPSAYPSRRAWLEVQIRRGREVLFHSGALDDDGRLVDVADARNLPHRDLVTKASEVPVYEVVPGDENGKPTTSLHAMRKSLKDNRLLPKGWKTDGPHAEETAPVGTNGDGDFVAGGDRVRYRIPIEGVEGARLRVLVWLRYQTIPPHWVQGLRSTDTPEAKAFIRMYDELTKPAETVDVTSAFVN